MRNGPPQQRRAVFVSREVFHVSTGEGFEQNFQGRMTPVMCRNRIFRYS